MAARASRSSSDATAGPETGKPVPDGLLAAGSTSRRLLRQSRGNQEILLQSSMLSAESPDLACPLYGPCIAGGPYMARLRRTFTGHGPGRKVRWPSLPRVVGGWSLAKRSPSRAGQSGRTRSNPGARILSQRGRGDAPRAGRTAHRLSTGQTATKPPRTDGRAPADSPAEIDAIVPQKPTAGLRHVRRHRPDRRFGSTTGCAPVWPEISPLSPV